MEDPFMDGKSKQIITPPFLIQKESKNIFIGLN